MHKNYFDAFILIGSKSEIFFIRFEGSYQSMCNVFEAHTFTAENILVLDLVATLNKLGDGDYRLRLPIYGDDKYVQNPGMSGALRK